MIRYARSALLLALALATIFGCSQPTSAVDAAPERTPTIDVATSLMPDQMLRARMRERAGQVTPVSPSLRDTRSHEQIAAAACTGPDGRWLCAKARTATGATPMLSSSQPIIPISWTVPNWFLDPANVSGTASDTNDCTTSATACLTCQEIETHRWGTYSPRLRQITTLTTLSSQSNAQAQADPCYFTQYQENNGGMLIVKGLLNATTQVATGVLGAVVAKNRATPQLLNAVLPVGAAVGTFVVNTTHPSAAFVYKNVAGNNWAMSQPLARTAVPVTNFLEPAEVDTWALNDSVTLYHLSALNIGVFSGQVEAIDSSFATITYPTVLNLNVLDPNPGTGNSLQLSTAQFEFVETTISREVVMSANTNAEIVIGFANVDFEGGVSAVVSGGSWSVIGGQIPAGFSFFTGGAFLDADFICGVTSCLVNRGGAGVLYIDTSVQLNVNLTTNGNFFNNSTAYNGGQPVIWGPGLLDVGGSGQYLFKTGAGQAVATFKQTQHLRLNQQTTAHSIFTALNVDTPCGGIDLTPANLDLAASATCATTGFGGLAFQPGGAAFSNHSQL